jgi:hypothetical protein
MWGSTHHRVLYRFLSLLLIAGLVGCASTQRSTERTETVTAPAAATSSGTQNDCMAGTTRRETVTTTSEAEPHPEIVRSTAGADGSSVIAAPFRVIGAALGAVF